MYALSHCLNCSCVKSLIHWFVTNVNGQCVFVAFITGFILMPKIFFTPIFQRFYGKIIASCNMPQTLNSSPPGQNGHHFVDDIFRCIFVNEKFCISIKISLKFVPNSHQPSIGLDNGMATNRRHAIIWTNADPIHWRIYAAVGGDEVTHCGLVTSQIWINIGLLAAGRHQVITWTNVDLSSVMQLCLATLLIWGQFYKIYISTNDH